MGKFCTNCGQQLESGVNNCPNCGAPVINQTNTVSGTPSQAKSKMAAGILGILLGAFGVHNFYLGYTGKAVAQVLITVLSCGTLSFASGIWGLIEGIMILTGSITVDGNGNHLGE